MDFHVKNMLIVVYSFCFTFRPTISAELRGTCLARCTPFRASLAMASMEWQEGARLASPQLAPLGGRRAPRHTTAIERPAQLARHRVRLRVHTVSSVAWRSSPGVWRRARPPWPLYSPLRVSPGPAQMAPHLIYRKSS